MRSPDLLVTVTAMSTSRGTGPSASCLTRTGSGVALMATSRPEHGSKVPFSTGPDAQASKSTPVWSASALTRRALGVKCVPSPRVGVTRYVPAGASML